MFSACNPTKTALYRPAYCSLSEDCGTIMFYWETERQYLQTFWLGGTFTNILNTTNNLHPPHTSPRFHQLKLVCLRICIKTSPDMEPELDISPSLIKRTTQWAGGGGGLEGSFINLSFSSFIWSWWLVGHTTHSVSLSVLSLLLATKTQLPKSPK